LASVSLYAEVAEAPFMTRILAIKIECEDAKEAAEVLEVVAQIVGFRRISIVQEHSDPELIYK